MIEELDGPRFLEHGTQINFECTIDDVLISSKNERSSLKWGP